MTRTETERCWAEIDLGALRENSRALHALVPPGCKLMNVLKADAYGHGAVPVARALAEEFPDDWIGVACLSEALELRAAGIRQEILILGWTSVEEAGLLAEQRLTQTLLSHEYALRLAGKAAEGGVAVSCHVKLDTGMSRIGYPCDEASMASTVEQVAEVYRTPHLEVTGIFTHFSSAYSHAPEDDAYTRMQFQRLMAVCGALEERGIAPGLRHCCSSPSTVNSPEYALDLCRVGTALFGHLAEEEKLRPAKLRTVMAWKARVAALHRVPRGGAVSYGRLYVAKRDMTLAVVTAGDADGFYRQLTNLGRVRIRGHACPVVGRVCMDMFMVDVTDFPDVRAEDEVLLLGESGGACVPCEWLFEPLKIGTSAVTCNIRARVPRIYLDPPRAGK